MSILSKLAGSAVLGLALLVPALALAQTSTTGLLNVYVQVINQTNSSYGPGNFTVAVSGQNPNPATFQGSIQGTLVTINPGTYSVTLTNTSGFNTSYSVGCDSTMLSGGTQTCVITVNAGSYNYFSSYVYPYTYQALPLTCRTDTPVVAVGQSARFTAVGGVGGTYNWRTPYNNFPNSGPVLTTTLDGSGVQSVTVTNASQVATCNVTVSSSYYPQPTNTFYQEAPYQTQSYYPRFPNTGFAPSNGAEAAFAVVLLMGAAIAVYPYARKAFALAVR
ncbi:MAG: hypothetical protein UW93_C0024G0009 [Parcubacteria group bacterium GW2011_GWC1_45_13]|nr:MAG: hypothetical protein UW93_C0024G0009 [Parcubacteria group bacterium GW2011_GWC1_45_13]